MNYPEGHPGNIRRWVLRVNFLVKISEHGSREGVPPAWDVPVLSVMAAARGYPAKSGIGLLEGAT